MGTMRRHARAITDANGEAQLDLSEPNHYRIGVEPPQGYDVSRDEFRQTDLSVSDYRDGDVLQLTLRPWVSGLTLNCRR
jgi:hypothetical protein